MKILVAFGLYFAMSYQPISSMVDNPSAEDTIVFPGCGPNFLNELESSLTFIASKSGGMIDKKSLDYSLDSIKLIDAAINQNKHNQLPFDPQLHCAYVAYIGEVIRRKINGRWELYHVQDEHGNRHFPILINREGKRIEVYGRVEKNMSSIEESSLASYVAHIDKPFVIKAEKAPLPIFPPVNDK